MGRLDRWFGVVVATALLVGCASPPPAGSPTAPASAAATASPTASATGGPEVAPPTLRALEDAIPTAMEAEVELVHELQREAGIADLLGADGVAVLAAVDEAQAEFAQAELEALVAQLGIDAPTGRLASISGPPATGPGAMQAWEPTYAGRTSFSASMLTAVLAMAISRADQTIARSSVTSSENYDKTAGDTRERVNVKTTLTLETGGGRISGQVELVTTTEATSVSTGARVGSLIATARGQLDVNACPDEDGIGEGNIALAWQEEVTLAGGSSAGGAASFEAPIRLVDGDDAHLVETQLDLDFSRGAHGPGSPGGDSGGPFEWGVTGSMSVVITAEGGGVSVSGVDFRGNATDAQAAGALTFAQLQASLIVYQVVDEAERFWRSGKCIELTATEESREVQPEEEVPFTVSASHRFDGSEVDGEIEPTLSGVESLDPDEPTDAPADFTFTAGERDGDKGIIELEHVSRRGIGRSSLEFTVGGGLSIALDGSWQPLPGNDMVVTLPETDLPRQDDGTYTTEAEAEISGTVGIPGCTEPFSESLPLRITVRRDEADATLARVRIDLASGDGLFRVEITCQGATTLFPIPTNLWALSFLGASGQGVEVTIDEPTTITGAGGSAGATTTVHVTSE